MATTAVEFDYEVFYVYATYAVIVLLKMISMSFCTSMARYSKKVPASREDFHLYGLKKPAERVYDPDVERVRKCHRNDLENIPPFLIIGFLYVFAHPTLFAATMHYRIFVFSRIFHMIAYLTPLPQPSRGIAFMVGVGTTVSMAVQILLTIGCHRNDLENIPPFLITGFLYVFAHPTLFAATMHYRIFVFSRIFHMIAYLTPLPQPSRGIAFMVGVGTTVSMAVQILLTIGSF